MTNRAAVAIGLAAALAAPSAASAMLADIPLEIIAGKAELIVVGEAVLLFRFHSPS